MRLRLAALLLLAFPASAAALPASGDFSKVASALLDRSHGRRIQDYKT